MANTLRNSSAMSYFDDADRVSRSQCEIDIITAGTDAAIGLAFLAAGRNAEAIRAITRPDSDGDGFSNQTEIDDLRHPGSEASQPGQPRANLVVLEIVVFY